MVKKNPKLFGSSFGFLVISPNNVPQALKTFRPFEAGRVHQSQSVDDDVDIG